HGPLPGADLRQRGGRASRRRDGPGNRRGMGRCQGRICGSVAAELLAGETGRGIDAVGRLRSQAPVKPIPLALTMAETDAEAAE
ncbi:hypothetical protein AB4156_43305, partial [Cupriavidus sp. 2MCAB6]